MNGTTFFIISNRCTRKCPFCFYSTGYQDHPAAEMDAARTLGAIEKLVEMGVGRLIITGGEPLLREDIMMVVRRAAELGLERLLLTNGELLDERTTRSLIECGIEGVTLSVNNVREAERLEMAASILQEYPRVNVTTTTVFSKINFRELPELNGWASSKGWGTIFQPAFVPEGSGDFDALSPHNLGEEAWKVIVPFLEEWGRAQGVTSYVRYMLSLYGRGSSKPRRCFMGGEAFVLDCDGSAYPCFHRRDLKAGNILVSPAPDVNAKLASFAEAVGRAPCYGEHCVSLFYGR